MLLEAGEDSRCAPSKERRLSPRPPPVSLGRKDLNPGRAGRVQKLLGRSEIGESSCGVSAEGGRASGDMLVEMASLMPASMVF